MSPLSIERRRACLYADWAVRVCAPAALRAAALYWRAELLEALGEVTDEASALVASKASWKAFEASQREAYGRAMYGLEHTTAALAWRAAARASGWCAIAGSAAARERSGRSRLALVKGAT